VTGRFNAAEYVAVQRAADQEGLRPGACVAALAATAASRPVSSASMVQIFPTAHSAMRSARTQGRYRIAPRWTYGPPLTSTSPHQPAFYREDAPH